MRTQTKSEKTPLRGELPGGTRARILDVAERLFAEHGLERVSIRDITREARANLGAINYHFGTKQKLIAAVFDRRLTPLDQERLKALDVVEEAAGTAPLHLEDVLEAFIRPVVQQALDQPMGSATFRKLMGRCLMEPNPKLEAFMRSHFEPVVQRFDVTLMRAMPGLTRDDLFWQMHLTIGALHHSLLMLDKKLPNRPCIRIDAEGLTRRLITFAAAGFRTSLPVRTRKSRAP